MLQLPVYCRKYSKLSEPSAEQQMPPMMMPAAYGYPPGYGIQQGYMPTQQGYMPMQQLLASQPLMNVSTQFLMQVLNERCRMIQCNNLLHVNLFPLFVFLVDLMYV